MGVHVVDHDQLSHWDQFKPYVNDSQYYINQEQQWFTQINTIHLMAVTFLLGWFGPVKSMIKQPCNHKLMYTLKGKGYGILCILLGSRLIYMYPPLDCYLCPLFLLPSFLTVVSHCKKWEGFCWISQVYRLHQLNRAAQLVTALSFSVRGAETTSQTMAINSSLGTLLNVLHFLGVICIWCLSSFLMRFFPSTVVPESWIVICSERLVDAAFQ